MGKVYLIGTGPGDEELLTLKALRVLKSCTAVLYDRLSNAQVLKYLNKDCRIFYCGKEPGCHYKTQDEINNMLVMLAKKGHTVGRIKGGDPYVFGRGGEEGLILAREGIEFEVIPGITSAIAVPSYAGIPVTQRGMSQSFHVFTGMSAKKLNINWKSAASSYGTLIFLMGLENIESIVENLVSNGKDKDTPCAVIMKGSTSEQRKAIGTLYNIASKVRESNFKSPCVIIVGSVVNLSESLNWYEKKPLFGWNVCVTRPKEKSNEMCQKLISLGAQVTQISAIKIKDTSYNLDQYKDGLGKYDYIVFTSSMSVSIFFDYLKKNEIDIRYIKARIAVIGSATEKSLRERGMIPEIKADKFIAEGLFEKLKSCVKPKDRILLPDSKKSRKYLKEQLEGCGCMVDEPHIYEPAFGKAFDPNAFSDVDVVLFTSPSTVDGMINLFGADTIKGKICVSIGPVTQDELKKNKIDSYVSHEHSGLGIIKKLLEIKTNGGNLNV